MYRNSYIKTIRIIRWKGERKKNGKIVVSVDEIMLLNRSNQLLSKVSTTPLEQISIERFKVLLHSDYLLLNTFSIASGVSFPILLNTHVLRSSIEVKECLELPQVFSVARIWIQQLNRSQNNFFVRFSHLFIFLKWFFKWIFTKGLSFIV